MVTFCTELLYARILVTKTVASNITVSFRAGAPVVSQKIKKQKCNQNQDTKASNFGWRSAEETEQQNRMPDCRHSSRALLLNKKKNKFTMLKKLQKGKIQQNKKNQEEITRKEKQQQLRKKEVDLGHHTTISFTESKSEWVWRRRQAVSAADWESSRESTASEQSKASFSLLFSHSSMKTLNGGGHRTALTGVKETSTLPPPPTALFVQLIKSKRERERERKQDSGRRRSQLLIRVDWSSECSHWPESRKQLFYAIWKRENSDGQERVRSTTTKTSKLRWYLKHKSPQILSST